MVQNWLHYRSFSPPEYDLKKVDVPVALIWSDNDWLADPKVRNKIFSRLRSCKKSICILHCSRKGLIYNEYIFVFCVGREVPHQQFAETCDESSGAISQI